MNINIGNIYKTPKTIKRLFIRYENYIGIKYVYGGNKINGTDCSGLIIQFCKEYGIKIKNRISKDIIKEFEVGRNIEKYSLILYKFKKNTHIAIVIDKNEKGYCILHCIRPKSEIVWSYDNKYGGYEKHIVYITKNIFDKK